MRAPATFPDEPEPASQDDIRVITQVDLSTATTNGGIAYTVVSEVRR